MDERDLRQAFHAAFDGKHPTAGAVDRSFAAVADQAGGYPMGRYVAGAADRAFAAVGAEQRGHTLARRLAGAAGVALALLVVATLLIARGSLAAHPATAPASQPTTAPTAAATEGPVGPAPGSVNQPPPGLVVALNDRVVLAGWSGSGQLQLTGDGGATWTPLRVPAGSLFDLQFVDNDTVMASTDAGLYRYQRSRSEWTPLSPRNDLVRLDFRDRSLGFAVTAAGDVVRTSDGGGTFSTMDVGIHPVTWLQWVSATHAWAAGPSGIVATSDGGVTWVPQMTLEPAAIVRAQVGFRDEENGFAVLQYDGAASGSGFIVYHTGNGGATWTPESCTCDQGGTPSWLGIGRPAPLPEPHSDLVVTGGSSAMLFSIDRKTGTASICDTSDSGSTWSCDTVPYEGGTGAALAVRGQGRWLVGKVGESGRLLASSANAGGTWTVRRP